MENVKQFIIALAVNMAFRVKYLIAALICLVLHFLCGLPLWVTGAAIGIWVIYGIIVTVLITFVGQCHNIPQDQKGISLHPGRNAEFDKMYRKDSED